MVGLSLLNSSLKLWIADTIVLTHALPSTSQTSYDVLPQINQELLEKPLDKSDNLRMLMDMNGAVCEVVTGVCVGQSPFSCLSTFESNIGFPSSVPCHLFTWIRSKVSPHLVASSPRPDGVP